MTTTNIEKHALDINHQALSSGELKPGDRVYAFYNQEKLATVLEVSNTEVKIKFDGSSIIANYLMQSLTKVEKENSLSSKELAVEPTQALSCEQQMETHITTIETSGGQIEQPHIFEPNKRLVLTSFKGTGDLTLDEADHLAKLEAVIDKGKQTPGLSKQHIEALQQAMCALVDTRQTQQASLVADLLLEQGQLEPPLKREIETFLSTPPFAWRQDLERYILHQQPFQLSYQDAADRVWSFAIRHAQLVLHERRQYLDYWCEQTEGNQDIPELAHNWCLRLDRIPEAAISPIEGQWQPSLDLIDVELHLFRGLAFAYQAKPEDVSNEWILQSNSPVRRVVRKISNSFWFFHEVRRYGEDCIIVLPQEVRDHFKAKLRILCQEYDLT